MKTHDCPASPTDSFYATLQHAFDYFNERLFDGRLPRCLLTVQRENSMGFFSPHRWSDPNGATIHELAINPAYFAQINLLEVLQTLVHEQAHLWQQEFGHPSRNGYHNSEWAGKMESIGLMPSSTGQPGGKRCGQKVADYPIRGGLFEQVCLDIVKQGFFLPYIDRLQARKAVRISYQEIAMDQDGGIAEGTDNIELSQELDALAQLTTPLSQVLPGLTTNEEIAATAQKKVKEKYTCPACKVNVWGKSGLDIICGKCNTPFTTGDNGANDGLMDG